MPVITVKNAFALDREEYINGARNEAAEYSSRRWWDKKLAEALQKATVDFKELNVKYETDVAVYVDASVGLPLNLTFISVDVLFDTEERTFEIRKAYAGALKNAALACYADFCKDRSMERSAPYVVEVAVRRFDPKIDVYI